MKQLHLDRVDTCGPLAWPKRLLLNSPGHWNTLLVLRGRGRETKYKITDKEGHSLFAQSLMARRASRKVSLLGTRERMESVTLQPLRLRTQRWSRFLSRVMSRRFRLEGRVGRASRANNKSIYTHTHTHSHTLIQPHTHSHPMLTSMPSNTNLMTGTKASGTALTSVTPFSLVSRV